MSEQALLHCLPLLAAALGRRHGLSIALDGVDALAEWPAGDDVLHLPPLPVEGDAAALRLLRGHIDMEAARIRYSDRQTLIRARLRPIVREICRLLEIWRTCRCLAGKYPGCGRNIRELMRHFGAEVRKAAWDADEPGRLLLPYLQAVLWSGDVPEWEELRRELRAALSLAFGDLPDRLEAVLCRFRQEGGHSLQSVQTARQVTRLLREALTLPPEAGNRAQEAEDVEGVEGAEDGEGVENAEDVEDAQDAESPEAGQSGQDGGQGASAPDGAPSPPAADSPDDEAAGSRETGSGDNAPPPAASDPPRRPDGTEAMSMVALWETLGLLDDAMPLLPDWLSGELQALTPRTLDEGILMAREVERKVSPLSGAARLAALQASAALRARLLGLLQAGVLRRTLPARRGRLDSRSLWRLGAGDTRIFCRHEMRRERDTVVHILLDASSSMREGDRMTLACQACFALMYALQGLSEVQTAITIFPGGKMDEGSERQGGPSHAAGTCLPWEIAEDLTVAPLVRPGQRLHTGFTCVPDGGTLLGGALWWALAQLQPLSRRRKLLIVLSDGEAQDEASCRQAIRLAPAQGVEVLGIGLQSAAIGELLPHHSVIIQEMRELPDALFRLLQDALLRAQQRSS